MKDYILEVCVDTVESALAAKRGGATRLELCANLEIGGTTPGYTLFKQVKKETNLPVRTMIRPRFGDFLYSLYEYQQMLSDIHYFAKNGVDGIVIGSLNADGTLNEEQMKGMIKAAGHCGITLHRAFDVCANPLETMKKAAELGIDTILTSGQEADCLTGCAFLKNLVQLANEGRDDSCGLTILVGAGVTSSNIAEIAQKTGARAFHMSGKKLINSKMLFQNKRVHMGIKGLSEFEFYRTDETEIRRAVKVLQSL